MGMKGGNRQRRNRSGSAFRRPSHASTVVLLLVGVAYLLLPLPTSAQQAPYATGAIPTPEEIIERVPKAPRRRAFLPERVDLSERFPTPGNQGRYGSCVAWAVGYAARSYYNVQSKPGRSLPRQKIPSPAYIYNLATKGKCAPDRGMSLTVAFEYMKDLGVLSLAEFPYSDKQCPIPSASQQQHATNGFEILDYQWVGKSFQTVEAENPGLDIQEQVKIARRQRLNAAREELGFGHPVIISTNLTNTFFPGKGVWRGDGECEDEDGYCGHAITLTGYDDHNKQLKFINSWGTNWGENGYGYMSYDAFLSRVGEAWVIRMPFEPEPPKPLPTPTPEDFNIALPDMDCGGVVVERQGRKFKLTGFAGKQDDVDAIRRAVAGRNDVTVDVELRPWPQCETLMTLRDVLADQRKPELHIARDKFKAGELMLFDVSMADYQGYLHVAYVQADGNVANLVQSSPTTLTTLSPRKRLTFGDGKEGRAKFTVSKPFGNEMVVVIASKSPLFPEKRPKVEIERDFLSALRAAIIARPDTTSPERLITADYYVLTTSEGE